MSELILKNILLVSAKILLPLCVPLIVAYVIKAIIAKETSYAYVLANKICQVYISCWWALLGMMFLYLFNPIVGGKSYAYMSGSFTSFLIISIAVIFVGIKKVLSDTTKYNLPIYQLIRNVASLIIGICVALYIPIISQLLVLLTPILLPIFALNLISDKKIFNNIIFNVIRLLIWVIILAEIILVILILINKVPIEYRIYTDKIVNDYKDLVNILFFNKK